MIEPQNTSMLSVDLILPPEEKIRDIDSTTLAELKESIKAFGVLQPILVRPIGKRFEIIFGYHRFLATKGLGLTHIPAQIKDVDDQTALLMGVIENIHRLELNPIREGEIYSKLLTTKKITELSRLLGKTDVYIKGRVSIAKNLHPSLKVELGNRLTIGFATKLSRATPKNQMIIFDQVERIRDEWAKRYIPKEQAHYGASRGNQHDFSICTCDRCGAIHKRGVDTTNYAGE